MRTIISVVWGMCLVSTALDDQGYSAVCYFGGSLLTFLYCAIDHYYYIKKQKENENK